MITPFLLAIILIAGVGVFTVTRLVAGSLQERFHNQLFDSANAASNTVVGIEEQLLATLRAMVFTQGVGEAVVSQDLPQLDTLLRPIAANDALDELNLYTADGQGIFRLRRISTIGASSQAYDMPDALNVQAWRGAIRAATSETDTLGDKFADLVIIEDTPFMFISAPALAEDGTVIGGISAGVRIDGLTLQLAAQALSSVALLDNNGHVLGNAFRAVSNEQLQLDAAAAATLSATTEATSPIIEKDLNGIPYQLLYAPFKVRSEPIGLLIVGLPTNFIVEQTGVSRDLTAVLFAVLFVVVSLAGITVARTITSPLQQLAATAHAVMRGDLSKRAGLRTPDELGAVSRSVDHMIDELLGSKQQVEELYETQREIAAQREAVLANISDAVVVQDNIGAILLANDSARSLMQEFMRDDEDKKVFYALLTPATAPFEPRMVELNDKHFSVLASPITMPTGGTVGRVTVFRDVTALVQAERLKDELVMQMSHELRTPLTVLRGNIELLRMLEMRNLSAKGVSFLNKTVEHMGTLERLINQVVDVSSIQAGRYDMHRQSLDLNDILKDRIEVWRTHMEARELHFSAELPEQPLPMIGDPSRLGEVVDHVLRNAYSYTLPGGAVNLRAGRENGHVCIMVQDSGVGIQAHEIERVFDRLYRGTAAEAGPTDSRGLGLGLYLTKHIVEQHAGTIHLDSVPDRGTVVHVELPAATSGMR